MKNYSKALSVVLFVILGVVFALGTILAFVPLNFGSKDYTSFLGALKLSKENTNILSATYTVVENKDNNINKSIITIGDMLKKEGYSSVNVYKQGYNTLKVEIAQPTNKEEIATAKSFLQNMAVGRFEMRNTSKYSETLEDNAELVVIDGWSHITDINIKTYQSSYGVELTFNKQGKDLYNKLNGQTLYIFSNGEAFPDTNNNKFTVNLNQQPGTTTMTLWFTNMEYAKQYYNVVAFGTIPVELEETVDIAYVEADTTQNIKLSAHNSSLINTPTTSITILSIATLLIAVAVYVLLIVKYKWVGVIYVAVQLCATYLLMFIVQAMPWVEIGVGSIIAFNLYTLLGYISFSYLIKRCKQEYLFGKSLDTSFADAIKNARKVFIDITFVMVIIGVVIAFVGAYDFTSIGIMLAVGAVINYLIISFVFKIFVKAMRCFVDDASKFCMPAREDK